MPSRKTVVFSLAILALAVIVGTYGFFAGGNRRQATGTGEPLIGGPFTLTDHTGRSVTDGGFRGRYMLVFFGYTNCLDICQAQLQVMMAALAMMGREGEAVQPILITVDPERDRPDILKAYVETFGSRLVGLTGSPQDIAAVAKAYHVQYAKAGGEPPSGYAMEHTIIIYLMGPDGRYRRHFTYTTDAAGLARDIAAAMATPP